MGAKPQIDDQFWFDLSKEAIQQAPAKTGESAGKMATMLIWLWGAYTAAVSIGTAFNSRFDVPLTTGIILVIPIPLLLIGYFCANWAQVAPLVRFDPRIPSDIAEAFSQSMRIRKLRLNIAMGLAILSAILVAAAIAVASFCKPTRPFAVHAMLQSQSNGADTLVLSGHFPVATPVKLRFIALGADGWNHVSEWTRVSDSTFLSSDTGDLQMRVPLSHNQAGYEVIAEWNSDGLSTSAVAVAK